MTRDNPNPSARHRTTDWDPAGKSELEEQEIAENFRKSHPGGTADTEGTPEPPRRPKDSDPSEMTDFEKNTTTEALKKEQPGPRLGERTPTNTVEREREPDSQSRF